MSAEVVFLSRMGADTVPRLMILDTDLLHPARGAEPASACAARLNPWTSAKAWAAFAEVRQDLRP